MFRSGYWQIGRFRGAPIRLHFSILLGLLFFSRFTWSPGLFVAYPVLVLLHELGHAALVRRCGHSVDALEVTGLGGACHWSGNSTPFEESLIAWGGVLAQLAVYVAATIWELVSPPESDFAWQVLRTFTDTNLWLMALNLLPIPGFDGARAWAIFRNYRMRGAAGVPQGSWRGGSADDQQAWYSGKRPRPGPRPPRADVDSDGPLNAEAQRALDRLLKSVTGKAKRPSSGD